MKFYKVYIEITAFCGLSCNFCPSTSKNEIMPLIEFRKILNQIKSYTNEVALHILGDPLTLSNLYDYLEALKEHNLKAIITTSGYFIEKQNLKTLFHPSIKQINISLNSFNKTKYQGSFSSYIEPILKLCDLKESKENIFINLRLWNIDEVLSEKEFNNQIFTTLSKHFNINLEYKKEKFIRLASKVRLHFDNYFEWPSLNNPIYGDGKCDGLKSHFGILVNGVVVPCCLDTKGDVDLGNIFNENLKDILAKEKTKNIIEGFKKNRVVEELCLKCSYKNRFKKD